jgi:hypothetical protein
MQGKSWIDRFMALSKKERMKRRIGRKGMKKVKYAPRKVFSKEDTHLYLKRNNIVNLTQLRRLESQTDCPSYFFVRKFWGNFEGYRKSIGFPEVRKPQLTDMEIIKILSQYPKARTLEKYIELHSSEPHLFVSRREVSKRFGGWKNCRRMADGLNAKSVIERYILFKHQLGRMPTMREAIDNGIELMHVSSSYREFKKFVRMLEDPKKYVRNLSARLNRKILLGDAD